MSRSRQLPTTLRVTVLIVILSLVGGLGAFTPGSRVASAAPLHTVPSLSVTVPAGGTATINVRAITLTPGAALPAGPVMLALEPLAADRLRTAVYYGIDWGYAESAPGQIALALWQLQDGTWRSADHAVAERIAAAAATSQGTPSWLADGSSLLTAFAQGQVSLSELVLAPLPENPSVGVGSLSVTNTSSFDLLLYLPYGTVFSGPNGSVIAWSSPALPGPQATPTAQINEPSATATSMEPTATPTPVLPPPAPPIKGETATPTTVGESTATPRPKDDTATPVPPTDTPSPEPPSATATSTESAAPAPTGTPSGQAQQGGTERLSPQREPASEDTGTATGKTEQAALGAPLPPGSATQVPNSGQSAPAPVSTTAAAGAPLPQPVGTQPGASVPNPVQTAIGTAPPGGQIPPPVASVPAGRQASPSPAHSPSPSPSPTVEQRSDATATVSAAEATPIATATLAPKPMPIPPTPAPVPPTAVAPPAEGPIINVAPGDTEGSGTGAPSPGESGSSGAPETYNPTTGGGPSALPVWLGLLSAVMVLGGWGLRRVSRPTRVRVSSQDDIE